MLPPRPSAANKGTFGKALVVAGSPGYIGAAYLAGSGAARVGAGLVTSACAGAVYPILAAKLIETTFAPLPDEDGQLSGEAAYAVGQALAGYDALLVGCGLGQSGYVRAFMRALLPTLNKGRLAGAVIDADGLNNLTVSDSETGRRWWEELAVPTAITPHPGEMARLCGSSVQEIESNRLVAARTGAARWGTTVVLKGAYTVVAEPSGHTRISPFANPGLASAGTGDVLAGATVGFIAQGMEPFDAASLAVFVHGLAAERVRSELGHAGMVASDLLPELPRVMKELVPRHDRYRPTLGTQRKTAPRYGSNPVSRPYRSASLEPGIAQYGGGPELSFRDTRKRARSHAIARDRVRHRPAAACGEEW